MAFEILHGDITKMECDAIVNAANSALQMGGGVCGAIFREAGPLELQRECNRLGSCETGQAVITKGYTLPASHVIHTVGPIWHGGNHDEPMLLRACYRNSLELAARQGLRSIAFPLISAGIYGYPREEAHQIAVETIEAFLETHEMQVYLVLFDAG